MRTPLAIRASFSAAVVLLLLSELGAIFGLSWLNQSTEQHRAALVRLQYIQRLSGRMKDAQRAERGYLLTGMEAYLRPYRNAVAGVPADLEALERAVADDPAQQARFTLLRPVIYSELEELARLVRLAEHDRAAAAAEVGNQRASILMDRVQEQLEAMRFHELRVADSSHAHSHHFITIVWILLGTATCVALAVLISVGVAARRRNRERDNLNRALVKANDELSFSVRELERRSAEAAVISEMVEVLQTSSEVEEAGKLAARYARCLFPGVGGAVYLINNSRDHVGLLAAWNESEEASEGMPQLIDGRECWSLRRGKLLLVSRGDPLTCNHVPSDRDWARYLCRPMAAYGDTIGFLHLISSDEAALDRVRDLSRTVAANLSLTIANMRLRDELQSRAIRDPLTGVFNRRYMEESLARELFRAKRKGTSVSVVMADVDSFKKLNDTFGHAAGDAVLKELGNLFRNRLRGDDVVCRFGGEEFALILPETSGEDAMRRAEQLREDVKVLRPLLNGRMIGPITASFGVSTYPNGGEDAASLIAAADAALYAAKTAGRDRVHRSIEPDADPLPMALSAEPNVEPALH